MKRSCIARRDNGTPCRRSARDGFATCARHDPAYVAPVRKPRAAKLVIASESDVEAVSLDPFAARHEAAERALDEQSEAVLVANSDADLMDDAMLGACVIDEAAAFQASVASDGEIVRARFDDGLRFWDCSADHTQRQGDREICRYCGHPLPAAGPGAVPTVSTASAVSLAHAPAGRAAEPVEAVDLASAHDHEADSRPSEVPPWPTSRDGNVVTVETPAGPHELVGFSDVEAVEVAHEIHERDHDASRYIHGHEGQPRSFHLAQMDCVAFLRSLGDETVDLIVTDPAYESLEKHRAIGTTTRLTADWFEIFRNERFPELLAEMMRVLKRDAHLYIYSDQETAFVTKPMAEAAGFKWWKHLVWRKVASKIRPGDDEPAAHGGLGYHYRSASEWIGFYEKGKRKLANLGVTDVLDGPRVRGYPTEKPVCVSTTLISQSCPPGGLVVDCFMGSGSTGEAAFLAGCRFAGCDVAERSISIARARLTALGGVEVGPPPGPVPAAQGSLFGGGS